MLASNRSKRADEHKDSLLLQEESLRAFKEYLKPCQTALDQPSLHTSARVDIPEIIEIDDYDLPVQNFNAKLSKF